MTQDPEEAHRSPVELAVLGDPAAICAALAAAVDARDERHPRAASARSRRHRPAPGEPLRAGHVLAALAERLPRDAILVEETPSSRPELHARIAATEPLGFVSAMGMLGFALPAAIGLRMARPDRPVLAVVGDGSSLYQIQALWSAARYGAGVLFVVLANGGYAIMDRLAERNGGDGPWPAIEGVDIAAIARALGCDARAHRAPRRAARARSTPSSPRSPTARPRCCSRSSSRRTRRSTSRRHPVFIASSTEWVSSASPDRSADTRPWLKTTTRSHRPASSSMSVEQISTGAPAAAVERISACISSLAPTSTPRVGSSSRNTDGWASSHLANTTFCWLPPDSEPAG